VRFWDTSAVVPLLIGQETSSRALDLVAADPDMVVWWGTVVESWSALARLRRNRFIDAATESEASTQLEALSAAWHEVTPHAPCAGTRTGFCAFMTCARLTRFNSLPHWFGPATQAVASS
jgi:hypothetical protein